MSKATKLTIIAIAAASALPLLTPASASTVQSTPIVVPDRVGNWHQRDTYGRWHMLPGRPHNVATARLSGIGMPAFTYEEALQFDRADESNSN